MESPIQLYNNAQVQSEVEICNKLLNLIDQQLPNAESKLWHAHPVWFLNGNPIVGYNKLKDNVRLMFWSGQSFDEVNLKPSGSFKAAVIEYTDVAQINVDDVERWLLKSQEIQWDYKNIVKRKGQLERLIETLLTS